MFIGRHSRRQQMKWPDSSLTQRFWKIHSKSGSSQGVWQHHQHYSYALHHRHREYTLEAKT